MPSLYEQLTELVGNAFASTGYDRAYGTVMPSNRPDLGQFQANGALAAAKQYGQNPRQIAQRVADQLSTSAVFQAATVAGPGFINLTLADAFLADQIRAMAADPRYGCPKTPTPRKIVVDYGGANIAKPIHVGHLRPAIIGESLKRIARFLGHDVVGDVHLGDWGLPMGLVIAELQHRNLALPYFATADSSVYPVESPVTIDDLEEIYPAASRHAQEDPAFMEVARQATLELQNGRPGYRALWRHFVTVSIAALRQDYHDLNVEFDLWLGESDVQDRIPALIEHLRSTGYAQESEGALIVDVALPTDDHPIPPLILVKSNGAVLYGTTDLATIEQRVQEMEADLILYVVDKRQSNHFEQVFRAAHQTGVAPATVGLEHIAFGTMNGKDGKPFKTRAGDVLRMRSFIEMVTEKAKERLAEIEAATTYDAAERAAIAHQIGIATLKYADLMNHRATDYIFDLDRFSAFEGRTGPYLLYTAVRAKSIVQKALEHGLSVGPLGLPADETERALLLKLAELPDTIQQTYAERAPNYLAEYAHTLAALFNRFYHGHHILSEANPAQQASWLALTEYTISVLALGLDLLGIETPARM